MYNLIYNTTFSNNILQTLGPLPIYVLIFAIIYFVMIRPQARKQKEHNQMLDNLKKGDRVVTNGGIVGVIKNIKGKDKNILEIDSSNTKLEVLRTHISANKTN
ncbi:MAG: preprotein translocase subunit YajC [Candidatus Marinimicrobia bacterium]|nr:preprotein translocase subunit YajC [Candidatus Neomarinimicrobiota bacterium]